MIAQNIRRLRQSKGVPQRELANAIFVSPSAISQYENDKVKPSRDNLALLADYFNVSVEYIEGTSRLEVLENQMNENYFNGITVKDFLEKLLCVSKNDRAHLVRVVDLMVKDNPARR